MSHRRSSSEPRRRLTLPEPPPYILDFSAQTCRPRRVTSLDDIRLELLAPNRVGWQRVLVTRTLDAGIGDIVGIKGQAGGWSWEFPEKEGEGVRICRARLWTKGEIYVLLLEGLPGWGVNLRRPRRTHSSKLAARLHEGVVSQKSVLEEKLWDALGDSRRLEDVLATVIYTSWTTLLKTLRPTASEPLWTYLQALESNADVSTASITPSHWTTLLTRLHQRIQLTLLLQPPPPPSSSRSLDRIAYLGGLLLPLTVVSGILSIEGTYGPEGSAFWVFWVAAGLSSVVALLVIHADRLRALDVWMEEEFADPERGEMGVQSVYVSGSGDADGAGQGRRRWRRRELGWKGAVKKMSGWYWWRGSEGLEWRVPDGWEERIGRGVRW